MTVGAQGFASGDLDVDAESVRMFTRAGLELLLAQSLAKNMGLYGERVGALSVVCNKKDVVDKVESNLKATIRPIYSSPPLHGAKIAVEVLGSPDLLQEWKVRKWLVSEGNVWSMLVCKQLRLEAL